MAAVLLSAMLVCPAKEAPADDPSESDVQDPERVRMSPKKAIIASRKGFLGHLVATAKFGCWLPALKKTCKCGVTDKQNQGLRGCCGLNFAPGQQESCR